MVVRRQKVKAGFVKATAEENSINGHEIKFFQAVVCRPETDEKEGQLHLFLTSLDAGKW